VYDTYISSAPGSSAVQSLLQGVAAPSRDKADNPPHQHDQNRDPEQIEEHATNMPYDQKHDPDYKDNGCADEKRMDHASSFFLSRDTE
jgi:hypothetical protein